MARSSTRYRDRVRIRKTSALVICIAAAVASWLIGDGTPWYWRLAMSLIVGGMAVGAFSLVAVPFEYVLRRRSAR